MTIRQISEKLSKLIKNLSGCSGTEISDSKLIDLIETVGNSNSPLAINSLLKYCFDEKWVVQETAFKAITMLYDQIKSKDLVWFDENLRQNSYVYYQMGNEFYGSTKQIASRLVNMNIDSRYEQAFLSILSSNSNGYVREAALRIMVEKGYDCLNALVLRSSDWVSQIRVYANTKLWELWGDFSDQNIVNSIPVVERLMQKTRVDNSELLKSIKLRLRSEKGSKLLFKQIENGDYIAARYAFTYLCEDDGHTQQLISLGISHRDVVIRTNTLKLAQKFLRKEELLEALNKMLKDTSTMIRRNVLYGYIESFPEQSENVLKEILFDKAKSLREFARFYLREKGIESFAALYRDKLTTANSKELIGVVFGLGETGIEEDYSNIANRVVNSNPSVRAASLHAVSLLKPAGWKKLILEKFESGIPAEMRAARDVLQVNFESFDAEELKEAYLNSKSEYVLNKMHQIFNSRELNHLYSKIYGCSDRLTLIREMCRSDLGAVVKQIKQSNAFMLFHRAKLQKMSNMLENLILEEQKQDYIEARSLIDEYLKFVRK